MKSLATTLLIFVTCIVVAGTDALIDRAQVTLSASSSENAQADAGVANIRDAATLAEFAKTAQTKLRLAQPSYPVAFEDLRPNDPNYAAAEAVYPFLHRQLICPECALTLSFSPKDSLTRGQAAVVLVSILTEQERISLLGPEQTADVLSTVPDVDAISLFARPYVATALADGILTLDTGNKAHPAKPCSRAEMAAAFDTIQHRFPPSAATASLRFANETGR